MLDFLKSIYFKYAVLPLVSTVLGILVKFFTKRDEYIFKKEDVAVGLDLMLTGILMHAFLITDSVSKLGQAQQNVNSIQISSGTGAASLGEAQANVLYLFEKLSVSGWVILVMVFGLWCVSTVVRKWGWNEGGGLRLVPGVVVPLVSGISYIIIVVSFAS